MVRGLLKVQKRKLKKTITSGEFTRACKHLSNFRRSKIQKGGRLFKVGSCEGSISEALHGIVSPVDCEVSASKSKPKTKKFRKDYKHKNKTEEVQSVVDEEKVAASKSKPRTKKFKKDCKHENNTEEVQRVDDEEKDAASKPKPKTKKFKKDCKQESNTEEVQGVVDEEKVDEISLIDENWTREMRKKIKKDPKHIKQHLQNVKESIAGEVQRVVDEERALVDEDCTRGMKKKFMKGCKHRNQRFQNVRENNTEEVQKAGDEEKIDEISLVDEDCTKGMRKWLTQYKESRPGLEVLQQRIDEFVTAHEEQHEQERKEREARSAEGGWTVVVHHKGRKKTTDAETGTVVGSVASAAVMDKMLKKKSKILLDFYRFQKKEAKMNELMMLQSKFEQDKKRIQQLRAARKFRPY